jgi:DNA invertase Pin-like site-specific DNA recombinase
VRAGKVDVVVAWALDRLARTARDRLALVEACRDAGVIIALVRGSDMDPTTPAGRLVVQGVRVARKRVWRLMRAAGLQGRHPKPWKRTTIAGQRPIDAADLIGRDFTAEQPNTRRGSAVRSDRAGQHRGAPAPSTARCRR